MKQPNIEGTKLWRIECQKAMGTGLVYQRTSYESQRQKINVHYFQVLVIGGKMAIISWHWHCLSYKKHTCNEGRRLVILGAWEPVVFVLILVLVRSLYKPKSTRPGCCCCFCSCQRMHISLPHTYTEKPPPHTLTHSPQHGPDHEQGLVNFSSRRSNIHGKKKGTIMKKSSNLKIRLGDHLT